MQTCLVNSRGLLDTGRLGHLWQQWRYLPRGIEPDLMTHGDLTGGNVLVADGRLVGVIDGGGLGPADPALDLVGAWHLLEDEPRDELRAALGCPPEQWRRGAAWAFVQAIGLVWYYEQSNPQLAHIGRTTLQRLLASYQ